MLSNAEVAGRKCIDGLPHLKKALVIFEQYNCLRDVAIASCNEGDIYLRSAEYQQAQAALRRSLSIVERIGDIPVSCFVLGNLGLLGIRIGNLADAEAELRKSVVRADTVVRDPDIICWGYACLVTVLLEQGKMSDAQVALLRALNQGRISSSNPSIAVAFVVLGNFRINQFLSLDKTGIDNDLYMYQKKRFLHRAKNIFEKVLTMDGVEVETRIECQLMLAQTLLFANEINEATAYTQSSMEEACQFELIWLVVRAYRLLGDIEVAHEDLEKAKGYYDQALHVSKQSGMRLEYARVLRQQGAIIFQGVSGYQLGLKYLREALSIFTDCKAGLDKQLILQDLERYKFPMNEASS